MAVTTDPVVETASGTLRGFVKRGARQFRGIPYAAPPVGPRRFRPPEPVEPWAGVRDCLAYGPAAPQTPSTVGQWLGAPPVETDEAGCLTLNVFTPACDDARRPVMVWLHGGAFVMGSGGIPWYDGVRLTQRDVVVVTLNYRLGALGFLHLEEVGGEAFAGSGNCGLLDQAAALRWVQENIAAFGGDPDNVTVFGESAGGMSTATLLGLPAARGLLHRAIPQSGACQFVHDRESADQVAREVLAELGIQPSEVARLRELPVEALLEAQTAVDTRHWGQPGLPLPFRPVVDGTTLPRHPLNAVRAGAAADVSLLVGTTRDEMKLFLALDPRVQDLDEEGLVRRVGRLLPPGTDVRDVVALYRARRGPDASLLEVLSAVLTDAVFRIPAIRLAEAHSAAAAATGATASAYMYLFTWATPALEGRLGAAHGLELPFMWDNLDAPGTEFLVGEKTPGMRELARTMADAWTAFARTGTPSAECLREWPPYEPPRRATMLLGEPCELVDDPHGTERRVWDEAG